MTAKTHTACAATLTLLLIQPNNVKYLTLSLAGGIIGGIIPDVDSKNSETNQIFDKVTIITLLTVAICIALEYYFNIGLYKLITKRTNIMELSLSIILFFIMCIIGSRTHHRSFTHSIIGLIIFSFILSISLPKLFIESFIIGYASHIFLDLLNHKGLKLFYPIKKRLCLDLCDSDGLTNNIIFYISIISLSILLINYCI